METLATKSDQMESSESKDLDILTICHNSFLFELMGLQYFKIKNLNRDNYKTGPTKLGIIRMIIVLSVLMSLVLSYIFVFSPMLSTSLLGGVKKVGDVSLKNILNVMIYNILSGLFAMVIFVGIVQSFFTTKGYKKFIMNLKDVMDDIRLNFNVTTNMKEFTKTVNLRRAIACFIFVSIHAVSGYFYILDSYQEFLVRTVVGFIPTFFLVVVAMKIIFTIQLTSHFLELLRKILQAMREQHKYCQPIIGAVGEKTNGEMITVNNVLICRQIYNKLFDNSEFINQKMGLTILCAFLSFVFCITVSGYELFLLATREVSNGGLFAVLHPNIQCNLLISGIVFHCQRASNLVSILQFYLHEN